MVHLRAIVDVRVLDKQSIAYIIIVTKVVDVIDDYVET